MISHSDGGVIGHSDGGVIGHSDGGMISIDIVKYFVQHKIGQINAYGIF